jgi:hypothetical protein
MSLLGCRVETHREYVFRAVPVHHQEDGSPLSSPLSGDRASACYRFTAALSDPSFYGGAHSS